MFTSRAFSTAVAVAGTLTLVGTGACAGHHQIAQGPPRPIAVEINNNLTIPTELTVYIVTDQGGSRYMLGTVPGAQTRTFTYTPVDLGQWYRFLAVRPLGNPISSPRFSLADGETTTVAWTAVPNQVQFYVGTDTTAAKPSATSQ